MDLILLIIAGGILVPMVLGPFAVKASHWVSGTFSIQAVPEDSLDLEIRAFLEKARAEFEALQFEFIGYMTISDYMPNMSTWFALFIDEQGRTPAMAAVIRQKTGKTLPYYEFTSRYSNGRVINVNNSPMLGSYRNPDKSTYRYPKINTVRQLYDIHRWVSSHDKRAIDPVEFDRDRAAEVLTEALISELKLQQKFGYYAFNEDTARFQLTWKGAFVMTEKNVFPVKNILNQRDLAAARKAIAGMPSNPEAAPGGTSRSSEKTGEIGAGLKSEEQFRSGASWFYWIAALTLVNSLTVQFGYAWNFVIGLGTTQIIDSIAASVKIISPDIAFQTLLLAMDLGFVALFVAFGLAAQKRSLDSYEAGLVFYAIDTLLFLLVFDMLGLIFHGIAFFFLVRGWNGLRKLEKNRDRLTPAAG